MNRLLLSTVAAMALLLTACPPCETAPPPVADAGTTDAADDGPTVHCQDYGTATAGEPCTSDCDCCGHACAIEHICAAPCLAPPALPFVASLPGQGGLDWRGAGVRPSEAGKPGTVAR